MSSKRGRKRNDALPPSRARDVQRAFRARRAAHLEALEDRVAVLEHENSLLRAALSLPPSERPALGRGPTGKEKPKSIFEPNSPPFQLVDLRRASVTTVSTDGSDISQSRSPISSSTASCIHDEQTGQTFAFPQWDDVLMNREDVVDSEGSSPRAVEGHLPPPLKISPLGFAPSAVRPRDPNDIVSPDSMHSRSTSYSQSSSASSAGPDGFSPAYLFNEDSHTFPFHTQNQSHMAHQHLSPPAPFSHFQYPSSAGAEHHSSPQFTNGRDLHNGPVLNISHARNSPHQSRPSGVESLGHRRAITEPQTLRTLAMQDMAARGHHSASLSAHPIRVPLPPTVPVINRDGSRSKFSMV